MTIKGKRVRMVERERTFVEPVRVDGERTRVVRGEAGVGPAQVEEHDELSRSDQLKGRETWTLDGQRSITKKRWTSRLRQRAMRRWRS